MSNQSWKCIVCQEKVFPIYWICDSCAPAVLKLYPERRNMKGDILTDEEILIVLEEKAKSQCP